MASQQNLTYADLQQALARRDPQLGELIVAYVLQPDPAENAPEEPTDTPAPPLAKDAWTLTRLTSSISDQALYGKTAVERWAQRRQAWQALMAAKHPPPRLALGQVCVDLYSANDEWSRAVLVHVFQHARLGWGLWRGLKSVFKLAEQRHDAEMFGVIAWRLDVIRHTPIIASELSRGTLKYMRRRAWRYLRELGRAVPELYPQFATQVLRHYQPSFYFGESWVASQIWAHHKLVGASSSWFDGPPKDLKARAFHESWQLSPDPLSRLLEDAAHDEVCRFAIAGLEADFKDTLRAVEPTWLARIGKKQLTSVDDFVVRLLEASPELHQSRLAGLGLHDMAVGLLVSDSDSASTYAINYCNGHAPDIAADELVAIADATSSKKVRTFVQARLEKHAPATIGLSLLIRMLSISALAKLAAEKLREGFGPDDLDAQTYATLAVGNRAQQKFAKQLFVDHKRAVPASFLRAHAEHPSVDYWDVDEILDELGKCSAADIGIEWIQAALFKNRYADHVRQWLLEGKLQGDDLDIDWVKSLAMRPSQRGLGLALLGNTKLVDTSRLGLNWLLKLARHSSADLSSFAHAYLLEHFEPADFAEPEQAGAPSAAAGIDRLWSLIDRGQPLPVRQFATTYLTVHHPDLSASTDQAKSLGIKPKLKRTAFSLERLRALLFDGRADVRRFAAHIATAELVRWGDRNLVYELAANQYREPRGLGASALLQIGETDADPRLVPPADWLSSASVFAMAESTTKASREVALTLIRRHYGLIGSAEKLAWLMDSPDREVRLFAVRLLWDQHRPLAGSRGADRQRFDSIDALRHFLRTVLFGLPPGRMERRDSGDAKAERPLPSSVAKRRAIEVTRDMGTEDAEFAAVIVPVLEEFLHSQAKGEWQACVTALAHMRAAHRDLKTVLPSAT